MVTRSNKADRLEKMDYFINNLEFVKRDLIEFLNPQPAHIDTTYQLESALKEIIAAVGLVRGVKAQWEET